MPSRAQVLFRQERLGQARAVARRALARQPQRLSLRSSLEELQHTHGNQQLQRLLRGLARSGAGTSAPQADAAEASGSLESSIEQARGGGRPLEDGVRTQMESAFGADFSGVRVHTDAGSHALNRSLQAEAFTTGRDIFFSGGAYEPATSSGRHLLAHELAHVVQQGGAPEATGEGAPVMAKLEVSQPQDRDELAAEETARAVTGALDGAAPGELEPHGDKKKSDDNGGPGVPEGIVQFDPKVPNPSASGTAVTVATVEKPQKDEWDNGFDEKVAKRFGAERHISLADLGEKLKLDPSKEKRRFQKIILGGHGNKDMLATGSGDGPDVGDTLNLKESNKATWLPYFHRDKFFGKGEIWVFSCNVGNGPIPQLIADQSGSVVYAYTRTAYPKEESPFLSDRKK